LQETIQAKVQKYGLYEVKSIRLFQGP
jgi:hypothetical protein